MKVTYNQIIDTFRAFANAHTQINEFASGDLWEVVQHNKLTDFKYPLLFVTDAPASLGEGEITMAFEVLVMDKAEEDFENEVKSDTLLILLDTIAYFEKLYADNWKFVTIQKSGSATPFTERFDDTVTGWSMSLSLKMPLQYDECQIPYAGHTPSFPDCDVATITDSDGSTLFTVASGGTAACSVLETITVSNSDDTYSVDTLVDLDLPDITHTDSDLSSVILPAQTAMVCTPAVAQSGIAYSRPPYSGQNISYELYDAKALFDAGQFQYVPPANPVSVATLASFLTLANNNAFGNTNRFTDELGLQTYANNYVVDHYTGLGWHRALQGVDTWAVGLSNANSSTLVSFSDWRLPTANEFTSIACRDLTLFQTGTTAAFNFFPMNFIYTAPQTCEISPAGTTNRITVADGHLLSNGGVTAGRVSMFNREHYT